MNIRDNPNSNCQYSNHQTLICCPMWTENENKNLMFVQMLTVKSCGTNDYIRQSSNNLLDFLKSKF